MKQAKKYKFADYGDDKDMNDDLQKDQNENGEIDQDQVDNKDGGENIKEKGEEMNDDGDKYQ